MVIVFDMVSCHTHMQCVCRMGEQRVSCEDAGGKCNDTDAAFKSSS